MTLYTMMPYGKSPTKLAHTNIFFFFFFASCICLFSLLWCVSVEVKNFKGNEVSVVNSDSVKEMKQ